MSVKEFFLASYARSGNTLVRLLLEHHFNIDAQSPWPSRQNKPKGYFRGARRDDLRSLETIRSGAQGIAHKTHDYLTRDLPALVIVRDGRDAMVSYAHYMRTIEHSRKPFEALLEQKVKKAEWSATYRWWLDPNRASSPHVLIKYERILEYIQNGEIVGYLSRALQTLGFDFESVTEAPLDSFQEYQKANPKFFRRGIVGSWKDEMPSEIEERFWDFHGETMTWLGYER